MVRSKKSRGAAMTDDGTGKAALITGGAGGVGAAVAEALVERGSAVLLTDLDAPRLAQVAAGLEGRSGKVETVTADVREVAECERVVIETKHRLGRLDLLVNCAGVWVEGDPSQTTEVDWDRCIDVNLKGTYFMCSRAIPELRKTGGAIVNIASDAGLRGNKNAAVYCASKGGVVLLTKALALDLARDGVRVNAVCPSDIQSPMLEYQARAYGRGDPRGYLDDLLRQYPQGDRARFIEPREVAALVVYLASPEAAAFTGAAVCMDFGASAGAW